MPSHYTHYRFGNRVLALLPAEVQKSVKRFPRLYDAGLQGPDPFFYYNILMNTPVGDLGKKYHRLTGAVFFTQACRRYRLEPTEGGKAYLYGLLGHYCLDSLVHPEITRITEPGIIGHTELETEFDRFLLASDGNTNPRSFNGSRYLKLSKGECDTAAKFFPPATGAQMERAVGNMAALVTWLASDRGLAKWSLEGAIRLTGDTFSGFVRHNHPNPNCAHLNERILNLYDQAVSRYPEMARQLGAHLSHNAPFEEAFTASFG